MFFLRPAKFKVVYLEYGCEDIGGLVTVPWLVIWPTTNIK